ncbi:hypothetical protein V9T40_005335 [Parthenolecanium corni]|uniref:Uncharacterized protein n=1 Tax=Parthenolecanium corni TaxID=536013 RepID=A0AAN9TGN6_9HEMI
MPDCLAKPTPMMPIANHKIENSDDRSFPFRRENSPFPIVVNTWGFIDANKNGPCTIIKRHHRQGRPGCGTSVCVRIGSQLFVACLSTSWGHVYTDHPAQTINYAQI